MKATLKNIRAAYNDNRRFASCTSTTGIVEFTHAVRGIAYNHYNSIQLTSADGKLAIYKLIQKLMKEAGWDGLKFNNI